MKRANFVVMFLISCLLTLPIAQFMAQEDPACPEAPTPQLVIGEQGRVLPGDPNNMRDIPARAGNLIGAIPGGEVFDVLDGPVCADGFYWWQVQYGGLTGWTVEGSGTDYWIEPILPDAPQPTAAPTATPEPTARPRPIIDFEPPVDAVNVLAIDATVRVLNDGDDQTVSSSLRLRAEPNTSGAILRTVEDGTLLTITDGPVEADGFRWWQLEAEDGLTGWGIEGLFNPLNQRYERSLLPICPYNTDRRAEIVERYIVTTDQEGGTPCLLDHLRIVEYHTFWETFVYIPNRLIWSPDGSQFAFVDNKGIKYDLYLLSADGSVRTAVTHDSDVFWIDWTPDGSRLVFTSSQGETFNPQVWTMRADGSLRSVLTDGKAAYPWAQWLDNESLIYVRDEGPQPAQVYFPHVRTFYTVNIVQGGLREIYTMNWDLSDVEVSPDNTHILLNGYEWEEEEPYEFIGSRMEVISMETGDIVFSTDEFHLWLFWTPDSRHIITQNDFDDYGLQLWSVFTDDPPVDIEVPFDTTIETSFTNPWWLDDTHLGVISEGKTYSVEIPIP